MRRNIPSPKKPLAKMFDFLAHDQDLHTWIVKPVSKFETNDVYYLDNYSLRFLTHFDEHLSYFRTIFDHDCEMKYDGLPPNFLKNCSSTRPKLTYRKLKRFLKYLNNAALTKTRYRQVCNY